MIDPLAAAQDAWERRAWLSAFEALTAADATGSLDGLDLERRGISAYLVGEEDAFLRSLERAFEAHMREGDAGAAVRCGFWLGLHHSSVGNPALGSGWFGRAGRALADQSDVCAEDGYLLLPKAFAAYADADWERCLEEADAAVAVAEQFMDGDVLAMALHIRGRARLRLGHVNDGLADLDEAMVHVISGALSPPVTGSVYCGALGACRDLLDMDRVREWSAALERWCDQQPEMVAYSGECRAFRAEVSLTRGEWDSAIKEARRVHERFKAGRRPGSEGFALYLLGEAYRLLGDFTEAEDAYRSAAAAGREPQPGLALLRLAQEQPAAAAAAIRHALAELESDPRRVHLLPAYVEILVAVGDLEAARGACTQLLEVLTGTVGPYADAVRAQAQGLVALAAGDSQVALGCLRTALTNWRASGVPFEEARTRLLIGRACRSLGDEHGCAVERAEAERILRELGALHDPGPALPDLPEGSDEEARGRAPGNGEASPLS